MAIRIFQLIFFSASFVCLGCTALTTRLPSDDGNILSVAIEALDNKSHLCVASDSSTEDDKILNILRYRRFEITSHELVSDEEGTYHDFMLKEFGSEIRIVAVVFITNEKCSGYRFTQIAQGD